MRNGYKPHLSFRNIEKTYVSDQLFPPFLRRLPDKRRPDFPEILKDLGLASDYTEMDLLRATGGRLATDNYEFVAPITAFENQFHVDFYIAGWRYYEGDSIAPYLTEGSRVRFQLEPSNDKDPKAVIVLTDSGDYKLGYIPSFYSGFIFDIMTKNNWFEAKIEKRISELSRNYE